MDENGVKNMKQVKHESTSPKKLWLNLNKFPEEVDWLAGKDSSNVEEDMKKINGLQKADIDLNELSYAEQLKISIEESNDSLYHMIYEMYFHYVLGLKEIERCATENKEIVKDKLIICEKKRKRR